MEGALIESTNPPVAQPVVKRPSALVKIIAAILFISLPFVGFWLGMQYDNVLPIEPVVTETVPDSSLVAEDAKEADVSPHLAQSAIDDTKTSQFFNQIDEQQFIYKGVTGFVRHLCTSGDTYVRDFVPEEIQTTRCLGTNALVLDFGGSKTLIDIRSAQNIADTHMNFRIGYNATDPQAADLAIENYVPESSRDDIKLMVSLREARCSDGSETEEDCDHFEHWYSISLADRSIRPLATEFPIGISDFVYMNWNDAGTVATTTAYRIGDVPAEMRYELTTDTLTYLGPVTIPQ